MHQRGDIRGIRLDSGDLAELARHARRRLDETGFGDMQVLVSGGLDEYEIHRLLAKEGAPIDGFGTSACWPALTSPPRWSR